MFLLVLGEAIAAPLGQEDTLSILTPGMSEPNAKIVCDQSKSLFVSTGVDGLRPFKAIDCITPKSRWIIELSVTEQPAAISVSVKFSENSLPLAKKTVPASGKFAEDISKALRLAFVDLPFHGQISAKELEAKKLSFGQTLERQIDLHDLMLFHSEWDPTSKVFRTINIGKAKKERDFWQLTLDPGAAAKPGKTIYARALRATVVEALTLTTALTDLFASSYTAIRFGIAPLKDSTGTFGQSRLFGLASELRGGRWRATQIYYDMVLRNEGKANGEAVFYEYQRLLLGYGFPFWKLGYFDAVTVTPKLGFWNFDAKLPFTHPSGPKTSDYGVRRSLGTGVEGGAEKKFGAVSLRGWLAADIGIPLGVAKGSVTSQRAGGDLLYVLPTKAFGKFGVSVLGFILAESITISDVRSKDPNVNNPSINIDHTYLGTGVALNW